MENQNVYSILGLRKGATDEEIKNAYVDLIKKFDPEKHTDRFMVIQASYEKLRHPEKRAREDILVFNFIRGRFLFTEEEKTQESDSAVNSQVDELKRRREAAPDDSATRAELVLALMRRSFKKVTKRLWAEAVEDWQQILEADPTHQRAKNNILYSYITLGYSYADHGLYDEALDLWEKAAQMNPDNEPLIHNLAICSELSGKPDKSKRYWLETIRRWQAKLDFDPDDVYTRTLIVETRRHHGGQALDSGERGPASIEEYREILKINPDDFEAQYKIATALYEEQNWIEAIDAWRKILGKYPKNIEALNMMGWSLLNAGKIEEAFQIWGRSQAIDPKNHSTSEAIIKARMSMGRAFRNRGMYTQSLVHFKALMRFASQSAEVYMEIGETYMLKGDKRSAAQAFNQAMILDPKNRMAKQRLSELKLRT
jgi:tetratricopeptide (TPR) repeat protein